MLIRTPVPGDTPARLALARAATPYTMASADLIDRIDARSAPGDRRLTLLAEAGGEVIGVGTAATDRFLAPGASTANVIVAPGHRGRGYGAALWARLAAHLDGAGAAVVHAATDHDAGVAFAGRRGFAVAAETRVSAVDPREVAEPAVPASLALVPLADPAAMRGAYALHRLTDLPSVVEYRDLSFADWRARATNAGVLDLDCSLVVFEDGEPIALTMINISGTRGFNSLAATRADHRGRGLAGLVKAASLRAAAAKGVTLVATYNDADNAPMIAVNTRLGYRPYATRRELRRG
ncbi:GNAT family N-acetyltransferase [Actinorhabdospora filicis]|uniref:GNAT family N-acetyltransferase n=1 Tax=Actinorhabdospora filicis TaxID=1785913 RepID=A0A9W6SFY7_9ACTN|nr:GNAT family N-acetyltransferase [Actinorhabdospora filicis]GLZ75297.1 GNAT family N-acetyltransferase [Actinorhabdospora filicis]